MLTQKRSYKEERKAATYEHFFSGVKIFLLPVNSIAHTCKHFLCWMRTLAVIMQMASKRQSTQNPQYELSAVDLESNPQS